MNESASRKTSIDQKPGGTRRLPDFGNFGVALRVILIANIAGLATVLIQSREPGDLFELSLLFAARLELPLFLAVLVLYALRVPMHRIGYAPAAALVVLIATGCAAVAETAAGSEPYPRAGALLWAAACSALALAYFDYRDKLLAPSLAEARLHALTVRMRPHFLFNSLNAVLGVIRSDPKRAERALEEMSDVFRAVMKENRELITISDELDLCERYLGLERLRLGERLIVTREIDGLPGDALIPPLMLQPLIENAVYHGIEPLSVPGEVRIAGQLRGGEVVIEISNPQAGGATGRPGNHMAMDNIRERLMLFYDLEASLAVESSPEAYRVRIRLPYRRRSP